MTRLGYLLPFLCAVAWGVTVTPTPAPTLTGVVTSLTQLTTATQVATTVDKVKTTVSQSNPAIPTSVATTGAAIHTQTTELPLVTAGTTKLTTTIISASHDAIQPTTGNADTKAVGVTSSAPRLSTIEGNTPNVSSPNDNQAQPTDLAKASTSVLDGTTIVVTSQPSITENATKLAATTLPFLKTSEQSNAIGVTNYSSTVALLSTLAPSPVTTSKTTVGSISVSTTSLLKETTPKTKPYVTHILEKIEVNCKSEHGGSFVKINIKPSRICGENIHEDDAKEILKHICIAVKPGYQPNKDKCHIDLGTGIPDQLVIEDAYVQSSLSPNDLYASIKHIKKDSSYLFQYDKEKNEEEDLVSIPLISAIVSLAVALLIIAAIYGCWHQRQTRKREQRLTEELQTMENGYHDNPTLEVMETAPEMQEKKGGPNGELGDSWIVPLDNLTREDLDDEEDTHL